MNCTRDSSYDLHASSHRLELIRIPCDPTATIGQPQRVTGILSESHRISCGIVVRSTSFQELTRRPFALDPSKQSCSVACKCFNVFATEFLATLQGMTDSARRFFFEVRIEFWVIWSILTKYPFNCLPDCNLGFRSSPNCCASRWELFGLGPHFSPSMVRVSHLCNDQSSSYRLLLHVEVLVHHLLHEDFHWRLVPSPKNIGS